MVHVAAPPSILNAQLCQKQYHRQAKDGGLSFLVSFVTTIHCTPREFFLRVWKTAGITDTIVIIARRLGQGSWNEVNNMYAMVQYASKKAFRLGSVDPRTAQDA